MVIVIKLITTSKTFEKENSEKMQKKKAFAPCEGSSITSEEAQTRKKRWKRLIIVRENKIDKTNKKKQTNKK